MKNLRCVFALLFLALSIHLTSQVNVQEFNTDAPKYYPFGEYDTIDSSTFRDAAYGSFKYSIGTWFKIAPTTVRTITSTEYDAMLHLTALDTDFPWDYSTCPSSMTQLADLILVRLYGGDSQLYVNLGSFTSPAISDQTGYGLVTDCWHFLYVGVDHVNGLASFGVFSDGCQGYYRWNGAMTFSGTYTNEALDNRLTLYLGGAKNHLSTIVTGYNPWPGQLYRTMFMSDFMTLSQPTARMLMNGEASNMYFFYLDDVSVSQNLKSYSDPNTFATMGSSPSDPTPTGVTGLQFESADSDSMYFTLSKDVGNYHFVSFWVKVDASTATSANHLIMSVVTPEGNEFISVIFVKASTSLTLKRGSATVPSPQAITLGTWHFVFVSFGYHTIDTEASIVVQFVVDTTQVLTNQVLIASIPEDYVQPLRVIHFGSIGGSDSVFDGEVRNVIGGTGSFFTLDTSSTSCIFSVGLGSPYCLYCPTSMYYDTTGTCLAACPSDTYLDSITNACIPCHETCATCTGPGPTTCTSCAIDTPVAFDSRCFTACPMNTIKSYDGTCECDESCSGCDYSEITGNAECVGCALPTYSLLDDASRCVDVGQCPSGYVSDLSSQTCETSCSGGRVIDYSNGKCTTYCPTNTAKVAGPPVKCHAYCPAGTFEEVITAGVTGETTRGCTVCTTPCATCLDSSSCLTCTPPYLYHEDVNECHLTCQAGFEYESENNFCQACKTGCTACSSLLSLYAADSTCVEECPIGTESSLGLCVAVTGVDAKILNNSGLVPPLVVSTRENLVLLGDYVAPSTISTVEWSLSSSALSTKFFSGVNKAAKDLVIPSDNLLDGTIYTVIYTVTDSLGNVGTDSILIKTETGITAGTFTVSPLEGTAFETEFTFTISGFLPSTGIKYDIRTFFEREQTINRKEYTERVKTMTIQKGVNAGTYTFVYPVSKDTIPFTVELCAYNDDQEICVSKKITVKNSAELPLQKVFVWTSTASKITEIGAMLEFVRSAAYFYTRDYTNLISTNYYRGLLLIKNLVIDKELATCSKVAECSNSGSCSVSGSSFTCDCESDQGGYNCYYGERDFDTVASQIADILKNLHQVTLTEDNVETAILILDQISNTMDMLEKNGIFYFRDIVGKILKVSGLEYHHYRYLFSILGETIEFAKRPLTSTWMKTIDQSLLLNNLTSLVETTFNQIDTIRTTEKYFIADTNFIDVFVISGVPSTLLGSKAYYAIDFETFGYKIPKSVLLPLNTVSIKLLGYKVNPYGQSQTNSQITSVSKLEIYDVEGEVSITSSADKIVVLLPKLTATPVFVPVASTKAWNCEFKTSTDGATINFGTTGCSLISENITHISCGCTHLTEFTGQLVIDNVASIPSSSGILDATTDLIASQILYETEKRRYIIETPETPIVIVAESPEIIRDFYWNTNALYIGIVVFLIYIFAALLNMGKVKKNSLKKSLEEGQAILVLTYHPVLSLFIRAHTSKSNTQLMRVTKFFCQLESYIALSGVFYVLLDLQLSLSGTSKLIASAIMTLLIAPLVSYIPEFAYQRYKTKKNEGQRMSKAYHKIQLLLILVWFLVGVISVGFIRAGYRGSWLGSLILAAILDLFVIDFMILIFAMVKRNNSKLLRCFQRKGYYVDVGSSAIMKNDDEAVLMAKIKKVLKKHKKKADPGIYPANDTSRALTFGDKLQLDESQMHNIEEVEDVNASIETDANNPFSPEMGEVKEDEIPINSKRSNRNGENQGQANNIYIEEDKPQVAQTRGKVDEEEVTPERRSNRQRTGKVSTNEEDKLFEVDSKLDLSELVNQIDKIARPKPRVSTQGPVNTTTIKRPSVPMYDISKRRPQNRNKTKS